MLERAVELGRANLGEDDPDVLSTAFQLAQLLLMADDPAGARRVLEDAYAAGQWRLGDNAPLMVLVSHALGIAAEELGNRHEARKAFGRVVAHGPQALGADHWAVAGARGYLGGDPPTVRMELPAAPAPSFETVEQPIYRTAQQGFGATGQFDGPSRGSPGRVLPAPFHDDAAEPQGRPAEANPISAGSPAESRNDGAAGRTTAPGRAMPPAETAPYPADPPQGYAGPGVQFGQQRVPAAETHTGPEAAYGGQGTRFGAHPSGGAEEAAVHAVDQYARADTGFGAHPSRGAEAEAVHAVDQYARAGTGFGEQPASPVFPPLGPPPRETPQASYARKAPALFAAVAAVLAAIIAVVALVVVLAQRSGAPADSNVPTLGGGPAPSDVRLRDYGTSISVYWSDPANGTTSFIVSGGRPGDVLKPMGQVSPGQTTFGLNGLNPDLDYCFAIVAVYSTKDFASSPQACTSRRKPAAGPSTTA
ncbi:MAG: hypothetical protein QOH97_1803 [Actinoplanes sp.]|nr:hypothetical protein [Actinoplanes sp.]